MADDRPALPRRRFLAAGVVGTVIATSGCLGDDGDGGDDSDGGDDGDGGGGGGETTASTPTETAETTTEAETGTPTSTPTETPGETTTEEGGTEATGEVTVDEIDEIEIVEWTSAVLSDQGYFQVEVTLRNAGQKEVRITPGRYRVEVTMYGEDGSELADTYGAHLEKSDLPPGETAWVKANGEMDDPTRVASYEIRLVCGGMGGEYCE